MRKQLRMLGSWSVANLSRLFLFWAKCASSRVRYNDDFPGDEVNGNQEQKPIGENVAQENSTENTDDKSGKRGQQQRFRSVDPGDAAPSVHVFDAMPPGAGGSAKDIGAQL